MTNEEAVKWLEAIREKYIHGGDEGFDKKRNEALDLAIAALERDRWISVEERLPEKPGYYFVFLLAPADEYRKELSYAIGMYFDQDEKLWTDDSASYNALLPPSDARYRVTYWRPLPEPPKEET